MQNKAVRNVAVLMVAATLGLAGCSSTGSSTNAASARPANPAPQASSQAQSRERYVSQAAIDRAPRTGEVYLMRGLMDIFSRGIDVMAAKINRAGVYAYNFSYVDWQPVANEIIARNKRGEVSYPVIIVGHSLGANDASKMANYLARRGVKISYVVGFDPTEPGYIGPNVARVVNFYLPNGDNRMHEGQGFKGTLKNISMAGSSEKITHTTIEKNPGLQNQVIDRILSMTKKKRR